MCERESLLETARSESLQVCMYLCNLMQYLMVIALKTFPPIMKNYIITQLKKVSKQFFLQIMQDYMITELQKISKQFFSK